MVSRSRKEGESQTKRKDTETARESAAGRGTREAEGRGKRKGESTPKIGSNKLSTIFAGLNTLKRLEIRLAGGPFVHGVPADRHEGLQRVIRARKREKNRVQERRHSSRRGQPGSLVGRWERRSGPMEFFVFAIHENIRIRRSPCRRIDFSRRERRNADE